ncbi:hypothetical protein FRX31_026597 [Thalictrum thalictroides]|uniref:Uncharacterized protein n=1 Tax=Thalictrum thalictroides TaxID=46969 RepID=A0A7J6VFD3_THATH|nr:hypothetical protein FRX31_026597 [Thalictrum thalictroides]
MLWIGSKALILFATNQNRPVETEPNRPGPDSRDITALTAVCCRLPYGSLSTLMSHEETKLKQHFDLIARFQSKET